MSEDFTADLKRRIDAIEEAYEFMLAYAAQGRESESDAGAGPNVREVLNQLSNALAGLERALEDKGVLDSAEPFRDVLGSDLRKAHAAVSLVLGTSSISSQLVDNLNASIHLRALLTDLFLLDEASKRR